MPDEDIPKYKLNISGLLYKTPIYKATEVVPMDEPTKPAFDIATVQLRFVTDDTIETDGYAKYDAVENAFICYTPPHVKVVGINTDSLAVYILTDRHHFASFHDYPDLFTISVDEDQKPCCSWYSPSAAQIKNGALQVEHYPYDKARKNPGCFNPDLTGSKNTFQDCPYGTPYSGGHAQCLSKNLSDWEDISIAYIADTPKYSIQRKLFANRIPSYRIFNVAENTLVLEATRDIESVRDSFDALLENDQDVVILSPQKDKKSYFKAVLSS